MSALPWRVSFRSRLLAFTVLILGCSMALLGLLTFRMSEKALERRLAGHLQGVVSSAAPFIDGDLLPLIFRREDGTLAGEEEFEQLRQQLERVKQANDLKSKGSPLYILRAAPGGRDMLEFVVMTDRDSQGRYFTGSLVSARQHGLEALAGRAGATGIYEDEEGAWISAAAPIRDSSGRIAGFLQADRTVGFFREEARKQAEAILTVAALCLCLGAGAAMRMARNLAAPVADLVRATRSIAEGDLEHRTGIQRNDELGVLAASVDRMASQIASARQELLAKQAELAEAYQRAEAASRAKSDFLATVSHELRTPLNAIIGYADLAAETDLDEDQRHCVDSVRSAGARLRGMVEAMLDFSRAESSGVSLDLCEFHPATPAEAAAGAIRRETSGRHLALSIEAEPELPELVESDPAILRRVLDILGGNAVKFTSSGGIVLRVLCRPNGRIRYEVADTGTGVPEQARPHLFKPFQQGDGSATRRFGGVGLGLATAHRLVQGMRGVIGHENRPEGGSVFWFEVPVRILETPNQRAA